MMTLMNAYNLSAAFSCLQAVLMLLLERSCIPFTLSSCAGLCSFNHLVHLLHVLGFVVNIWLPCMCFSRISALWDDADLN